MRNLKSLSYFMMSLVVFGSFAPFVSAEFGNPSNSNNFNSATNNWQSSSPTFDEYYSGSAENYWPILKNLENDQCDAVGSDFVVMIPPGGCSPMVVRSDLLAEQNVPVFCQLSAIRVNPLIDVSAIKSISFKGDYPDEVAGISFHPARAGASSHSTLLGSPIEENIGYVVIVLKRQPNERDLTEYIKGMLTATIKYDAQGAFGTGAGEYYLAPVSDSEWERNSDSSSFWKGKGYLRVEDIDSDSATIEVLTGKDDSYKTVTLEVGETSSSIYYPGQYCTSSLRLKLNKIDNSESMARIDIDGDTFWVRKGSKLFDGKCKVKKITIGDNGEGTVSVSCSGAKSFELQLRNADISFEYGDEIYTAVDPTMIERVDGRYYKKNRENWIWYNTESNNGVVNEETEGSEEAKNRFYRLADEAISNYKENTISDVKYSEGSNVTNYMNLAKESVLELVDNFPAEKEKNGEYWGENALYKQIMLAGVVGDEEMQFELIDRFLKEYPKSVSVEYLRDLKLRVGKYDYSGASKNLFINNKNYNIRVDGFISDEGGSDSVDVRIGGGGVKRLIKDKFYGGDGMEIGDSEKVPRLVVMDIDSSSAKFNYTWEEDGKDDNKVFSVDVGKNSNVGGVVIAVVSTNVREVAHISLIPEVLGTKTEANFTFNIGVEKRVFELTPEKAQEKIDVLNESIAEWENRLEILGKWVKGLKGACFATSSVLMLKSMVSGFSGAALARGAVMDVYEAECREEGSSSSTELHKCYSEKSDEIERSVEEYATAIDSVNEKVKCAKTSEAVSDGFFESKVVDTDKYVKKLKSCAGLSDSWEYRDGAITVKKDDLRDASDYRAVLLKEEACKTGKEDSNACKIAKDAMEKALGDNVDKIKFAGLEKESKKNLGTGFTFTNLNINARLVYYKIASKDIPLSGSSTIEVKSKYSEVTYEGKNYVVTLDESNVVKKVYEYKSGGLEEISDGNIKSGISGSATFIEVPSSGSSCSNVMTDPYVRYYESQNQQGFAATVPFDISNGWYAYVDANGYTESGVANAFWICNVGSDGVISDGVGGGDICVRFSVSSGSDVPFTPCPSKSKSEVTKLYSKAESAIREANRDGNGINVDGQYVSKTSPMNPSSTGVECTDFMSADDCNLMFNVCDPVICPTSRCDLGGKFPVADVISTGIIGSTVLCLPNFGSPSEGGVLIPVCLSGIHAGIDAYLSVLKSHKSCLEKNIESGEYVGICDEISAVYMCEFFWGQLSPVLDSLLPQFVGSLLGKSQTKGGAEYLTIQKSFDNLDKSVNYFTSSYAEGAFRAFDLRNTKEVGSTVCKGFVGSSVPTSLDFIDSLTDPESPTQFYAYFSEDLFSEATVPSTSHYRIYYHIYAGNDAGVQYKVYLKNPPESSYYANRQSLLIDSGYAAKGVAADKSIDITAPSGYKELCVDINGRGECGFSSVTSDFGLNYVSQSYIADQADDKGITRTEDCVTTSTSGWGMANLNIQDGVEKSIGGEDIATSGITRICASANPEQGIVGGNDVYCKVGEGSSCDSGYTCTKIGGKAESGVGICEKENGDRQVSAGRWIDVGYCDSESVRCWIDSDSVKGNLDVYMAMNDIESVNEIVMESRELTELKEEYKNVREKLDGLRKRIKELEKVDKELVGDGDVKEIIKGIIEDLNEIIGLEEGYAGQGTNADKAEALMLKFSVYREIVRELLRNNPDVKIEGGNVVVSDVVVADEEKKGDADEIVKREDSTGLVWVGDGKDGIFDNSNEYLTTCHEFIWPGENPNTNGPWRTDRNNNPTAFTTELADQAVRAGLISDDDYSEGDWFEGIHKEDYYTAKLIGDSIAITIKVIDSLGFYTNDGSQQRWVHTVMGETKGESDKAWSELSNDEKVNVIRVMYYREAGSGSIFEEWGYGKSCDKEVIIEAVVMLRDLDVGDIIKNKEGIEYRVKEVMEIDGDRVLSLENVEVGSASAVIRGSPVSLLKDYGNYGYSVVSYSEDDGGSVSGNSEDILSITGDEKLRIDKSEDEKRWITLDGVKSDVYYLSLGGSENRRKLRDVKSSMSIGYIYLKDGGIDIYEEQDFEVGSSALNIAKILEEYSYHPSLEELISIDEIGPLLEEINEGDFIKDRDGTLYSVGSSELVGFFIKSQEIVLKMYADEITIKENPSFVLRYYGDYDFKRTTPEGIARVASEVHENTDKYEESSEKDEKPEDITWINISEGDVISRDWDTDYEIKYLVGYIYCKYSDTCYITLKEFDSPNSIKTLQFPGSRFLSSNEYTRISEAEETKETEVEEVITKDIIYEGLKDFVEKSEATIVISEDFDDFIIEFKSGKRSIWKFDDAKFYLSEDENNLLIDLVGVFGAKGWIVDEIEGLPGAINEEIITIAKELNEVFKSL